MMITKQILDLHKFAGQDRSELARVAIRGASAMATDGIYAVKLTEPEDTSTGAQANKHQLQLEDVKLEPRDIDLTIDDCKRLIKRLPAWDKARKDMGLEPAMFAGDKSLIIPGIEISETVPHETDIQFKKEHEGYLNDMLNRKDVTRDRISVKLNAKLLKDIIDFVAKHGDEQSLMILEVVADGLKPIKVEAKLDDGTKFEALLMPIK